jgi:hydroxypyruvate reductase
MLARKPACIISGGEPVVTLKGSGKGGRNQEMALAFLAEIQRQPDLFHGVTFLAAATDGNDGPTDAAGALASLVLLQRAQSQGLSIGDFLGNNDAYNFFEAIGGLFKTGPTNTNVCDLHILLVVH